MIWTPHSSNFATAEPTVSSKPAANELGEMDNSILVNPEGVGKEIFNACTTPTLVESEVQL